MKTKLFLIISIFAFSCKEQGVLVEPIIEETIPPTFNLLAGTYNSDIDLTLVADSKEAIIYYTLDGSEPSETSAVYSAPINIKTNGTRLYVNAMSKDPTTGLSEVTRSFYKIDYSYDSTSINSQLSLEDFKNRIVGKWIGVRSTPWTPKINVEIIFNGNETYTSKSLTPRNIAFYYGDDSEVNSYSIFDTYEDRSATGFIYRFNNDQVNRGDLEFIKFSEDLNTLHFEFWHRNRYGPIKYTMTRVE
jgi:hypothetical protein